MVGQRTGTSCSWRCCHLTKRCYRYFGDVPLVRQCITLSCLGWPKTRRTVTSHARESNSTPPSVRCAASEDRSLVSTASAAAEFSVARTLVHETHAAHDGQRRLAVQNPVRGRLQPVLSSHLSAEVHGSRTHPRPGSWPSNRFEDGEAHRDPSTSLGRRSLYQVLEPYRHDVLV